MIPMLKTIISGMFKKSSTINYPAEAKEYPPILRGVVEVEIEKCIYCGICRRKCPAGAIEVEKAESSWSIERFRCIQCNSCVESCPKKCLRMDNRLPKVSEKLTKDTVTYARVPDNDEDN